MLKFLDALFFFLLISQFGDLCLSAEEDNLLMVFILSRHGDRSPVHTFPRDPFEDVWKTGYGQLTEYGANQHYGFGKLVRSRYSSFLPENYHKDEVLFRSSGTERTIMSANNFILGLYPKLLQGSVSGFPPVFSRSLKEDYLLKMSSECPQFRKLYYNVMNSPTVYEKIGKFGDLFGLLEQKSGLKFPGDRHSPENLYSTWKVCDPVTIWVEHNLHERPSWVTQSVYEQCIELLNFKHYIRFSIPSLTRLRGGPLAGHMIKLFRSRIKHELKINKSNLMNEKSQLLVAYFGHDSTLAALLNHLGIYNGLRPPLASSLIVELYNSSNNIFYLKFFYRNETKPTDTHLWNLWPPSCGSSDLKNYHCLLNDFELSLKDTYAQNLRQECYTKDDRILFDHIDDSVNYYPHLIMLIILQTIILAYLIKRFTSFSIWYVFNYPFTTQR